MRQSSYRAQDHGFGQLMLRLRTAIGLTQAGLAGILRVSRHAVSCWETGQTYPKPGHLKQFIELCVRQQVFTRGREAEEIRDLWQAARQRLMLDEQWLHLLLNQQQALAQPTFAPGRHSPALAGTAPVGDRPRLDWDDALDVPAFYGREAELALLTKWVVEARCRVVSVLGLGGIGKSALTITLMRQVAAQFDVVIWRSLRDAPACELLLDTCLQVLTPQSLLHRHASFDARLHLLMEQLRGRRVLLVLDNAETLLEEGTDASQVRPELEGYQRLLRQLAETTHQSCLLLTSRERLAAFIPLEGDRSPVRALELPGLDAAAGVQLLAQKALVGSPAERTRLIERYTGSPLALNIVAQTIEVLFGGAIAPFLGQGEIVFGGVRELLNEQFERLSALERQVFFWLTILREPVRIEEFQAVFVELRAPSQLLDALAGLRRRSLIERGQRAGTFTLQSVVLEYATARLITEASDEIVQGRLDCFLQHALCLGQAKEYVRQVQRQLLVAALLTRLRSSYPDQTNLEGHFLTLLNQLRAWPQPRQGYGPANLVGLVHMLRGNLRGLDLSRLALRSVSLQDVEMQDTQLSGAALSNCLFTEPLDAITAVTISSDGAYWAAANWRGEVRVWREAGRMLVLTWQAHAESVITLTFSPRGEMLASGSWDGTVKVWDSANGSLLWEGWHDGGVNDVAFSPDGRLLASGGLDGVVRLRSSQDGALLQELPHPGSLFSLAWSPDSQILATGDFAGTTRLWHIQPDKMFQCAHTLTGHSHWVTGLAFAPDGLRLATGSFDATVKVWDTAQGTCLHTYADHQSRIMRVGWSPDGRTIASAGFDQTVWLYDYESADPLMVLQGHTAAVASVAYTPDSRAVLSGSNDGTIRLWEIATGRCERVVQGYTPSLFDVDWSPDGIHLASGGKDALVTLWNQGLSSSPKVLSGHRWAVQGVAWSPDGRVLASGGYDNRIGLWDTAIGRCLAMLDDSDGVDTVFQGLAWQPNGTLLACGTYMRGVQVWDMTTNTRRWVGQSPPTRIRRVAWCPDGKRLAGGGDDGNVYLWDATDGTLLWKQGGHNGAVVSVAWSPDGRRLASAGGGRAGGELFIWEAQGGGPMQSLAAQQGLNFAVVWNAKGDSLISGDGDGTLCWWDLQTGMCEHVRAAHQGAVQALKRSPDGQRLASCGDDGAIILWDIQTGELLETIRRDRPYERMCIDDVSGITPAQHASLLALGAVE